MIDQQKALPAHVLLHISQTAAISLKSLAATIELIDGGGTVPFIARYRKEQTGNLDEVQVRLIEEKLGYFRELEDRRATILGSIGEQGKLTPELKARVESTLDKSELEDLYLPYKPKRRTKATMAREKGLQPLADYLWNQAAQAQPLAELAAAFVDAEKGVAGVDEALEGARHIVAETISENADYRKALRDMMMNGGVVVSRKMESGQDPEGKFKLYYDSREAAKSIPSHRMLAIRRGENENVLFFTIEMDNVAALAELSSRIHRTPGDWTAHLQMAIEDCWKRLLNTSIQTDIRMELKRRADEEAIKVFRENLQNLLLAAPAGRLSVLALDPGLRTGCKVAAIDDTGKYLEDAVIYPHEPRKDTAGAARTIDGMIRKHGVKAIAIGNGTASRETESFVRQVLAAANVEGLFCVVVSEAGASVYSASDIARQEFPELDLTVRGAISIGRRLQDPLAELVKVDPKSIGVGQYQHDVDQRQLQQSLDAVVETCVNRVGVDLNTASWALLRYVAGISERTAQKIVEYRNEHGRFRSRAQLNAVSGVGPKTFEQAAGFLRIRDGENPLDSTAVHPESYAAVEGMAARLSVPVHELVGRKDLLDRLEKEGLQTTSVGVYTFKDIVEELRKPGRDPRDRFVAPSFRDDVKDLADVQPGMKLEGVVTNVTKFGAFVDIGVHQDGLVHVSELSNRYVQEPSEVVKVGQIVKVQVLTVDTKAKRIALSMKALMAPAAAPGRVPGSRPERKPQPPQPTMDDKLSLLASKWKSR